MFREIIDALKKGPTTPSTLARELGVETESVRDALLILEDMGVVEEVKSGCERSNLCLFCPLAKSCNKVSFKSFRLKEGK
ncbi:MAG: winged helix-turn-helix transcriptional regulator [Thermoplasmata archaeon]|nr:winged helix-turn-helix transcriptional regulator [Thermoplasmata archaeon]